MANGSARRRRRSIDVRHIWSLVGVGVLAVVVGVVAAFALLQ